MLRFPRRAIAASLPLAIAGLAVMAPAAPAAVTPDVAISMTGPAAISAGELGTWVITVTNTGSLSIGVDDIVVDNPLFKRYGLVPDSTPADGRLQPGAKLTYTQTGRFGTEICGDKMDVTNDARVRLIKVVEGNTANNTATVTSPVRACRTDLAVTKSAAAATYAKGDTVAWTVTATNVGTTWVRWSDVTVTDAMVPGLAAVDVPADGWLAPNASVTYRGTSTADACGALTNTAAISIGAGFGAQDVNAANNTASSTVQVDGGACAPVGTPPPPGVTPTNTPQPQVLPAVRPEVNCPATMLGVSVTAPRRVVAGQVMRVLVTGRNLGHAIARDAVLRYRVPEGASLVRIPSGARLQGGALVVRMGDLAPGAARRLTVSLTLNRTSGARINRATATAGCASAAARTVRTAVSAVKPAALPAVTG